MTQNSIDNVKQEIRFYMQKSLQRSLGYVGTFIAIGAMIKLDLMSDLLKILEINEKSILATAVLLVNALYLNFVSACLFAIMKRGYYILLNAPEIALNNSGDYRHWECFVRRISPPIVKNSFLDRIIWNVDNYYMLPLFLFIGTSSLVAMIYGWDPKAGIIFKVFYSLLVLSYIIPIVFNISNGILNKKCRNKVDSLRDINNQPPTS